MERNRNFFAKALMFVFLCISAVALIACKDDPVDPPTPDPGPGPGPIVDPDPHTWTENELFWDADKNGIEDWQEEEITLTYATWQYNNPDAVTIDTLMIEKFMEKYPNVHVEMQIVGEDEEWEANMLALLETEEIPDVFLIRRLENMLPYGVLADLTDFYNHDEDTEYIFESVRDLGLYNGRRYSVPSFIYPEIWIVNLDLLEQANLDAPSYEWTWGQMENIAKAASNQTTHVIGLYGTDQYYFELPKIQKIKNNEEVGMNWLAYGYDGERFNYDDTAFINAMTMLETGMAEGWLVNQLNEEMLLDYYGETLDPRYAGHVAIWRQPSWEFKDYADDLQFNWDVYPGPSGVTGGNTDIVGISVFCEHQAAAYQLLKWMSYSEEGLVSRYALYEEFGDELYVSANNYPYPVVDYGIDGYGVNKIWDNIPYTKTAPGYGAPEFIDSLRHGAIKANKEVIGWDASEDTFKLYIYDIIMNGAHYATLYETIQTQTDLALAQKREAVAEALQK